MPNAALAKLTDHGRALVRVGAAALDPDRPLMANLIVTRRCNLSCGYCFEYDKVSPPVPLATLRERIDHLARLRTVFVTLTGGEALLHPDLAEVVAYVRERGMTPFVNTNGFLLTRAWIEKLNRAGLFAMQLSIDNVTPNQVSVKSLKTLRPKLELLAEHAEFVVRVAAVLGSGSPEQAVEVAEVAMELGFDAKAALVRDGDGALMALDLPTRRAYDRIRKLGRRAPSYLSEDFQVELLRHGQVSWKCRAGARYFHVCEDGYVHYCSANHGKPGTPLADYDVDDIRRAFDTPKPCAPTCTQSYAHQVSRLDRFRSQTPPAPAPAAKPSRVHLRVVD